MGQCTTAAPAAYVAVLHSSFSDPHTVSMTLYENCMRTAGQNYRLVLKPAPLPVVPCIHTSRIVCLLVPNTTLPCGTQCCHSAATASRPTSFVLSVADNDWLCIPVTQSKPEVSKRWLQAAHKECFSSFLASHALKSAPILTVLRHFAAAAAELAALPVPSGCAPEVQRKQN